jgi:hypothetical protein
MPTKATKRFTAWSYSRLHDHEECAFRAKLKHLDHLKEPGSPALDRGAAIHKLAEDYVTKRLAKLPSELKLFANEFKELRKISKRVAVEQQLAVNDQWDPCDWFGADAWLRVVLDACYVDGDRLIIVDHKTGKLNPEHADQLDLYAVVGFIYHPEVDVVEANLWYLDQGEVTSRVYSRDEALKLRPKWLKRVKPFFADAAFKPVPSYACRWCFFGQAGKAKGGIGQCKF